MRDGELAGNEIAWTPRPGLPRPGPAPVITAPLNMEFLWEIFVQEQHIYY